MLYLFICLILEFFQHRICFSIQPQLQLVNLHRNRRYFVIKLHTWFCLSYFLKTNIKFYCIYQYFMRIIKITNDRIKIITGNEKYSQKQDLHFTSCQNMYNVDQDAKCVHKQTCVFGSPSQQSLSPLHLVNLHRNRRYFVIKLHTWFCLSYFLKANIKLYCIYQYFMSINSFYNTDKCYVSTV
jgi:hypothetical protein